jgi:hypothetical protein
MVVAVEKTTRISTTRHRWIPLHELSISGGGIQYMTIKNFFDEI